MFRHILYYVTSVFLLLHPYVCYSTDYKPDKETEKAYRGTPRKDDTGREDRANEPIAL